MKNALLLIAVLVSFSGMSQSKGVIAKEFTHFSIQHKKDTIDFVVADTVFTEIKPILLFCQGSQPVPLFLDFGDQGIFHTALSNFDLSEMRKQFYVVVISMPKTPIAVGQDHLNKSYNYILDTTNERSYSHDYLEADYLENYVRRGNQVIQFLRKQKWVDTDRMTLAGHSQGARIAVALAHSNKYITQLGLFGYNPMRRIDQLVWNYRKQAQKGEITWRQADSLQQQQYEFYEEIQNEDSVGAHPSLIAWRSFSTSSISELTSLEIPIYIAFGSEDPGAEYCDLVPLSFIENGKTNYVMKRYANLEHNFFPLDEEGIPDYSNGKWIEVMNAFLGWCDAQ